MSFKEKSIMATLIIDLVLFTYYFLTFFRLGWGASRGELLPVFAGVVVLIIVSQIVLHIILAIQNLKNEDMEEDERDTSIASSASRIGYHMTAAGLVIMALVCMFTDFPSFLIGNILLLILILSESVAMGMQLFYYSKGR